MKVFNHSPYQVFLYLFISFFLITISSCNKDDDVVISKSERNKSVLQKNTDLEEPFVLPIDQDDPRIITPKDVKTIRSLIDNYSIPDRSFSAFSIPEINDETVAKISNNGIDVFSISVQNEIPLSIFNLVIKLDQNGELISENVLRYKMSPDFGDDYYKGDTDFSQFVGKVQYYQPHDLLSLTRQNIDCLDDINCCETGTGGGTPSGPTGTGGGTPGSGGGGPSGPWIPSGGDGGSGGGGGGGPTVSDCYVFIDCIACWPSCEGICHPETCNCNSVYVLYLVCEERLGGNNSENRNSDCCPGSPDGTPVNLGVDPSTVRDEEVPTDFTDELQAGLNSNNFLNDFLGGNTNIDQSTIMDAAICANCQLYPFGSTFAPINNYNQCVLTQIINDSPCGNNLENLISESGITLTPTEILNLIGPNGAVDNCNTGNLLQAIVDDESIDEERKCPLIAAGAASIKPLTDAEEEFIKDNWDSFLPIHNASVKAFNEVVELFGFHEDNTCSNAILHSLWMAISAQSVGEELAYEFGLAHENRPNNPLNTSGMDRWNNEVGAGIGANNPDASIETLINLLCNELEQGNLKILENPNDTSSDVIPSSECQCPN